jgi:axial budding pattern protein 2
MLLSSIFLLAAFARSALAAPTLAFPLAEQSPPVARVDEVFDFTLLPGTFTAVNTSALLYTTTGLPSWVAFNNVTLSFTGTPSLDDEPESSISLTATDTDGTAVTSSFDLIVSTNPAPTVHLSLPRQIAAPSLHAFSSAVPLASNAGIVIHPYWSFSIGFQMDTVRSSSGAAIYYSAHQRGFTSLPDWLEFHNDTMTFYGVAPLNGSYTIVATGSDYPGYSGAQTSFVIQVAGFNNDTSGPLDFKTGTAPSNDTIIAVAGGQVDYEIDLSGLTVGGKETTASEREGLDVSADISLWNWLSFDR